MKITLDLTSVVVGGAVALALGVVAGFSPQVTSVPAARPATAVTTMGANRPAARDIVWLEAQWDQVDPITGQTIPGFDSPLFTVPAGKILVVTALSGGKPRGFGASYVPHVLRIDGIRKEYFFTEGDGPNGGISFDVGIPLMAGQTVQVIRSYDLLTNLHGYLEDA